MCIRDSEKGVAIAGLNFVGNAVYSEVQPDVENIAPVSYTHLDVYKRQGLDCPNCSAKIEKEVGELDGVQSSVVNLMKQTLTINVTPVSYTHLEVYKRQLRCRFD